MIVQMTALVGSRALSYQCADGSRLQVTVELGTPAQDPDDRSRDWGCPFRITGFGEPIVHTIVGVDAMQALILALHLLPTELEALAREDGGRFLDGSDLDLDHACRVR